MKTFRKFDGAYIDDVSEYVVSYLNANPLAELMIGCDSKQGKETTTYALAIGFYTPGNGAHVIYQRETVPRIRDLFTRLWGEVERSKDVAEELTKTIFKDCKRSVKISVHLDVNKDAKYKSNSVYQASLGYIKGFGYDVQAKPTAYLASYTADLLCK